MGGFSGAYCERKGDCLYDRYGACCKADHILSPGGICCSAGHTVDVHDRCCAPAAKDGCNVCGGQGKYIDSRGSCCPNENEDADGACCFGALDVCGAGLLCIECCNDVVWLRDLHRCLVPYLYPSSLEVLICPWNTIWMYCPALHV